MKREGPLYDLLPMGRWHARLPWRRFQRRRQSPSACWANCHALDGTLRPVSGVLGHGGIEAYKQGYEKCWFLMKMAIEASYVEGLEVYGCRSLKEAVQFLSGGSKRLKRQAPISWENLPRSADGYGRLCTDQGQQGAKRAMEIAAAGGHNILLMDLQAQEFGWYAAGLGINYWPWRLEAIQTGIRKMLVPYENATEGHLM